MARTYYKPNSKNSGSLLNVAVQSKGRNNKGEETEGAVYFSIVKQTGWDANNKNGSFKDGNKINIKFNALEISSMIRVIEKENAADVYKFFHGFNDSKVSGEFKYLETESNGKSYKGFVLNITKGEEKFRSTFTLGESADFKAWLEYCREHIFNGLYSIERKKFEASQKNKQKPAPVKKEEPIDEPEVEPEEDNDDISFEEMDF